MIWRTSWKFTLAEQPFAPAMPTTRSRMMPWNFFIISIDVVRMVPTIFTSSGMIFEASPPWMLETPMTCAAPCEVRSEREKEREK